jgi:putative membrane protein
MKIQTKLFILLGIFFLALGWSAIQPYDYFTWFLEVIPALVGLTIVVGIYHHFKFSMLAYGGMTIHAIILMIGGKYTYALVPAGFWFQDIFNLSRNHYDRLGHLAQGFFPAIIIREILLRNKAVKKSWVNFIVASIALAISACYEFFEWWVSLATGSKGDSFLGTQGDVWDTQWDMFLCLIGAILAVTLLNHWHDRSMKKLKA